MLFKYRYVIMWLPGGVCCASAHLWSSPHHVGLNRHILHREPRVRVKPVLQRKTGGGRPQQRRAAQTLPGARTGVCARLFLYFGHTGVRGKLLPRGSTHRARLLFWNDVFGNEKAISECTNTPFKLFLMSKMSTSRVKVGVKQVFLN